MVNQVMAQQVATKIAQKVNETMATDMAFILLLVSIITAIFECFSLFKNTDKQILESFTKPTYLQGIALNILVGRQLRGTPYTQYKYPILNSMVDYAKEVDFNTLLVMKGELIT